MKTFEQQLLDSEAQREEDHILNILDRISAKDSEASFDNEDSIQFLDYFIDVLEGKKPLYVECRNYLKQQFRVVRRWAEKKNKMAKDVLVDTFGIKERRKPSQTKKRTSLRQCLLKMQFEEWFIETSHESIDKRKLEGEELYLAEKGFRIKTQTEVAQHLFDKFGLNNLDGKPVSRSRISQALSGTLLKRHIIVSKYERIKRRLPTDKNFVSELEACRICNDSFLREEFVRKLMHKFPALKASDPRQEIHRIFGNGRLRLHVVYELDRKRNEHPADKLQAWDLHELFVLYTTIDRSAGNRNEKIEYETLEPTEEYVRIWTAIMALKNHFGGERFHDYTGAQLFRALYIAHPDFCTKENIEKIKKFLPSDAPNAI